MKKHSIILYLSFTFLVIGIVNASDGWQILSNIESARPSSICTNHIFQSSLTGILYNPAQLSFLKNNSLDFTATKAEGSEQNSGGFIYANSSKTLPFAISYFSFDYGTAELSWIENNTIVSRNVSAQKDSFIGFTLARPLSEYSSCGLNIKYINSNIAETASAYAIAFDAGFTVKNDSSMSLTIACQNIGVTSKFIDKSENLPSAINLGLNYWQPIGEIYLTGNANSSYLFNEQKMTPEITVEAGKWPISFFFNKKLYDNELNTSFGVGICLNNYEISYSFTPSQWLGNTQKISFYYKFGNVIDAREDL
ncbi:MAG: hypothetical protein LHV68_05085 [Elusimicrobia bacterium]|nr:hypothetical protein [Candidatus Liberimonas magnetica]